MQCWKCSESAKGVCIFCGRGIFKEHAMQKPAIVTIYTGKDQTPKAIVVSDALFCGECHPEPEPIEMPEIY